MSNARPLFSKGSSSRTGQTVYSSHDRSRKANLSSNLSYSHSNRHLQSASLRDASDHRQSTSPLSATASQSSSSLDLVSTLSDDNNAILINSFLESDEVSDVSSDLLSQDPPVPDPQTSRIQDHSEPKSRLGLIQSRRDQLQSSWDQDWVVFAPSEDDQNEEDQEYEDDNSNNSDSDNSDSSNDNQNEVTSIRSDNDPRILYSDPKGKGNLQHRSLLTSGIKSAHSSTSATPGNSTPLAFPSHNGSGSFLETLNQSVAVAAAELNKASHDLEDNVDSEIQSITKIATKPNVIKTLSHRDHDFTPLNTDVKIAQQNDVVNGHDHKEHNSHNLNINNNNKHITSNLNSVPQVVAITPNSKTTSVTAAIPLDLPLQNRLQNAYNDSTLSSGVYSLAQNLESSIGASISASLNSTRALNDSSKNSPIASPMNSVERVNAWRLNQSQHVLTEFRKFERKRARQMSTSTTSSLLSSNALGSLADLEDLELNGFRRSASFSGLNNAYSPVPAALPPSIHSTLTSASDPVAAFANLSTLQQRNISAGPKPFLRQSKLSYQVPENVLTDSDDSDTNLKGLHYQQFNAPQVKTRGTQAAEFEPRKKSDDSQYEESAFYKSEILTSWGLPAEDQDDEDLFGNAYIGNVDVPVEHRLENKSARNRVTQHNLPFGDTNTYETNDHKFDLENTTKHSGSYPVKLIPGRLTSESRALSVENQDPAAILAGELYFILSSSKPSETAAQLLQLRNFTNHTLDVESLGADQDDKFQSLQALVELTQSLGKHFGIALNGSGNGGRRKHKSKKDRGKASSNHASSHVHSSFDSHKVRKEESDGQANESFWQYITRKVLYDFIGLNDELLEVIVGERFIDSDHQNQPKGSRRDVRSKSFSNPARSRRSHSFQSSSEMGLSVSAPVTGSSADMGTSFLYAASGMVTPTRYNAYGNYLSRPNSALGSPDRPGVFGRNPPPFLNLSASGDREEDDDDDLTDVPDDKSDSSQDIYKRLDETAMAALDAATGKSRQGLSDNESNEEPSSWNQQLVARLSKELRAASVALKKGTVDRYSEKHKRQNPQRHSVGATRPKSRVRSRSRSSSTVSFAKSNRPRSLSTATNAPPMLYQVSRPNFSPQRNGDRDEAEEPRSAAALLVLEYLRARLLAPFYNVAEMENLILNDNLIDDDETSTETSSEGEDDDGDENESESASESKSKRSRPESRSNGNGEKDYDEEDDYDDSIKSNDQEVGDASGEGFLLNSVPGNVKSQQSSGNSGLNASLSDIAGYKNLHSLEGLKAIQRAQASNGAGSISVSRILSYLSRSESLNDGELLSGLLSTSASEERLGTGKASGNASVSSHSTASKRPCSIEAVQPNLNKRNRRVDGVTVSDKHSVDGENREDDLDGDDEEDVYSNYWEMSSVSAGSGSEMGHLVGVW